MEEVSNKYISEALHDLINLFGVRRSLSLDVFCKPFGRPGDLKKCIEQVALQLGLPVKIDLTFIPEGYNAAAVANFNSRHVVKSDGVGYGSQGIVAEVGIPNSLPLCNSKAMEGFPISVKVRESCKLSPATFITVMAHELSHVLLYSMRHAKKDNEFYTDLTAMLLGFAGIMKTGRKLEEHRTEQGFLSRTHHTKITTYGYLSDKNFEFAFATIQKTLDTRLASQERLRSSVATIETLCERYQAAIEDVKKLLKKLDDNPNKKFAEPDLSAIIAMHQPNYISAHETRLSAMKNEAERIQGLTEQLRTKAIIEDVSVSCSECTAIKSKLDEAAREINSDRDTLKKYMGLWDRLVN